MDSEIDSMPSMLKIQNQPFIRYSSVLLLLVMSLHTLSIHGFMESLVYCTEADGEINIESNASFSIAYKSKADLHNSINHEHTTADIHQTPDNHNDFSLSETCTMENRVNRFDQTKAVQKISNDLYQSVSILPNTASKQLAEFIPPIIEQQDLASLRTVVLLN